MNILIIIRYLECSLQINSYHQLPYLLSILCNSCNSLREEINKLQIAVFFSDPDQRTYTWEEVTIDHFAEYSNEGHFSPVGPIKVLNIVYRCSYIITLCIIIIIYFNIILYGLRTLENTRSTLGRVVPPHRRNVVGGRCTWPVPF